MFSQWSRHLVSHSQAAALCSPPCATRNRAARVYVFAVQSMSSTTGAGAGGGANSGARRVVVWYRGTDLRLHDQPAVHEAASRVASGKATEVLPVFCFDPRFFSASVWGTLKTGAYRAQFLLESVADLKASLRRRGSDLLVCVGRPEEVLPALARALAGALGRTGGEGRVCVDLPDPDEAVAADVVGMANFCREYGPRIANAEKNTGASVYAFNALQRAFFPTHLQAPRTTIGGKHS